MRTLTIGITGASGFIGGYLLSILRNDQRFLLRPLYRKTPIKQEAFANVQPMVGDLHAPADCARFCRGLDVIVHLAHTGTPMSSRGELAANCHSNMAASLNLIEAIRDEARGCKVIFASSGGTVYGLPADSSDKYVPFTEEDHCGPLSFYGIQKYAIEHYLRLAAENEWLSAIILRISNPYGVPLQVSRGQGIVGIAMQQAVCRLPLPIYGSLDNVRDYVHLDDVVSAIRAAMLYPAGYEVFNIGSGVGHSLRQVLNVIGRVTGAEVIIDCKDADNRKHQLVPWVVIDPAKAICHLGWSPTIDLETGIRQLWALARPAPPIGADSLLPGGEHHKQRDLVDS